MIDLDIPGHGKVHFEHLVCDVNGTLTLDGSLIEGITECISAVLQILKIHLVTADTHGRQHEIDQILGLNAIRLAPGDEAAQKADIISKLGSREVIAIGQGANDAKMLKSAGLGICILSPEGTHVESMMAADIIVPNIFSAFDLITKPPRMIATLRR